MLATENRLFQRLRASWAERSRRSMPRFFSQVSSAAPRISLVGRADDNGLAIMLSDLVRQNLEAKAHKKADFEALEGRVSIVADDADVALTLVFEPGPEGGLTIHDGIVGIPDVTIRGPSDSILALSNMPLSRPFGLPIPGPGDREAMKVVSEVVRQVARGRLHFYGMIAHVPLVLRLTRVMSVNG